VLCSAAVLQLPFYRKTQLPGWLLLGIFWLKIAAGFAFAWFYKLPRYYDNADTWRFYKLSLTETVLLKQNPVAFLKDLFSYGYDKAGHLFSGKDSYWNDLKSNILIKLLAVMNVGTNNSYYTNIVLFNFLFFFGLCGLYTALKKEYHTNKWLLILPVFLIPSTLFWSSGIHKDGLILSAIGLVIYYCSPLTNKRPLISWIAGFLGLVLIFALRNYVAFALLPALACWWLAEKKPRRTPYIFMVGYLIGLVLFFTLPSLLPAADFPGFIASKHAEFKALTGGSSIETTALNSSFSSFAAYLPTAIDMVFLRPHLTEAKGAASFLAVGEIFIFFVLLILSIVLRKRSQCWCPTTWFLVFFSITPLLIAGYTVTFSGAIVRYRSLVLPFILVAILSIIDYKKLVFCINYKK